MAILLKWLSRLLSWRLVVFMIALQCSCRFDTSGIGGPEQSMWVSPRFVCPGDPVTISWDAGISEYGKDVDFCCGDWESDEGCIVPGGGCSG